MDEATTAILYLLPHFKQNGYFEDDTGDNGILNTASEVCAMLHRGNAVMCIFPGDDNDVPAAYTIYGRDCARILHLEQFADAVGTLIQHQIRGF